MLRKWIHRLHAVKLAEYVLWTIMWLFQRLPVRRNVVMFESFLGKQYSDSPKAIYEAWRERYPNDRLIWSFDTVKGVVPPPGVPYVKRLSLKWVYYMAVAHVWISNSRLPKWLIKRPETFYLQTWHGTPLKKLGLDMKDVKMADSEIESYKEGFAREARKWDALVSPNAYSSDIFPRAFAFDGELLEVGYPRNDLFYRDDRDEVTLHVREKLGIAEGKKVVLYAPTWRDQQHAGKGKYTFTMPFDVAQWSERFGNEYVLLVRLHYFISNQIDLSAYEHVRDVSAYPDIADLYLASDVLVTDYSSVMFDYAHLRRPMLFYTYDLSDYRDEIRGFYFDFENESPGPLVSTQTELFEALDDIEASFVPYVERAEAFERRFCSFDNGEASDRVVRHIKTWMEETS